MSYEWITPKTDWDVTSKFVYTDYNRIRNNLLYINDKINNEYPSKAQTLDLGEAKTDYTNDYYPSEFTAFEDALESFIRIGQDVNIGTRSYYKGNSEFIDFDALNRLESCCLRWYTLLNVTVQSISITPNSETIIEEGTYNLNVSMSPSSATTDKYTYTVEGATGAVIVSKNGMTISLTVNELELQAITITVSYKDKTAVANVKIGAGTWFIYNNVIRYYDFIYLGSNLDKSGVSTLIAHYVYGDTYASKTEFEGCYGINNTWGDNYLGENSEYMADIQNFVDKYFGSQLKEALQSVTKWMQRGYTDRYQYTGKYFLPSRDEIMSGGSSSSIYTELKTVPYEYFYGQSQAKERWNDGILIDPNSTGSGYIDVLTRSIVDSAIYGGKRDKNACVITSNDKSYYSTIHLAGFRYSFPLRPLFFLSNNLKVKQSSKSGIDYEIDWTGTSEIVLSSIPVGSIVADIGEQADYEEYELPYSFGNGGAMVISKVNDVQRIHLLGGSSSDYSVLDTHYMFNPQDKTFEQSTALPTALFSLQATPYYTRNGNVIRTYGGVSSLNDSGFTNKVYYASSGGAWSEIGTIPYNAGGHSLVSGMGATYSGSVFLLGGDDKLFTFTTRRKFYKLIVDTNIVQEYSPLPFDMIDGSAIWYNNTIYAITRDSDSLYYWKDNSTWEEYARLPHTNDGGKLMIVGEGGSSLYYFGGSRSDLNYYKLNTQTKQFEIVGQLPYPFQYGAICCYKDGKIYLAGGNNNNIRNKMYKILKY